MANILFFLFILLIIIFIILSLLTLKFVLKIENINISTKTKNGKFISPDYQFILAIYLFEKLPIFRIKLNEKRILKMKSKKKLKEKVAKMNDKILHNYEGIDNKIFEFIKHIKFNIKTFDLYIEVGLENIVITSFIIPIISTFVSIFLNKYSNSQRNKFYLIKPMYINKNIFNFQFSGIFEIKMIHIINTICVINKERKGEKYERTSNRRTYDYSYE